VGEGLGADEDEQCCGRERVDCSRRSVAHDNCLEPVTRAVIRRTATAVTVKLAGATHLDVTDLPCLVRGLGAAARIIRLGSIGCAGTTTTNAVVLAFLDTVLRDGKPTPSAASLTRGSTAIR
jgi:hypothetical protein